MQRLRLIRQAFGYPLDFVAEQVQRPANTVKAWEAGTDVPSIAELRDLALLYETGVDDLAGDESLESRLVRTCRLADDDGVDGFWGHLGVMLPQVRSYRWYSITTSTAVEIDAKIGRRVRPDGHTRPLLVDTLNNRLLWINLSSVKSICLCDDANEWPEPYVGSDGMIAAGLAEIEAHPNHLIPQVVYEVITERSRGEERPDDVSSRLRHDVDRLLEARREALSGNDLKRLLLSVRLWMTDGSVLWTTASRESMKAALADLLPGRSGALLRFSGEDDGQLTFAFPLDQIAVVDLPAAALRCHEMPS